MNIQEVRGWREKIISWALRLGFVGIGFTDARPLEGLADLLQTRLAQGLATPFEAKDISRRVDPKAVWQDCRGIIALAYPLPYTGKPEAGEGTLARSAVGEDYHQIINRELIELSEEMKRNHWPGEIRRQVDTGPLLERAFALRAGLGWTGRNQQLIIPGYGSFAGLALMLMDQELPGNEQVPNRCGSCQKCVQACPAQILGKDVFEARNCYSYLTQAKEVLTSAQSLGLGGRIFGCDACQEVCPHNQAWLTAEQEASALPLPKRGTDLMEVLNLSKGTFKQRFQNTAAGWRGKGILQRNALLALQNTQDPRLEAWLADHKREIGEDKLPAVLIPYL